jgi:hypothetical protein
VGGNRGYIIYTVKLGYSNIGFCDTLYIASNIIWKCPFLLQRYSFITTLFLGPFDDVITEFYCIYKYIYIYRVYRFKRNRRYNNICRITSDVDIVTGRDMFQVVSHRIPNGPGSIPG